ncbi:MAG: transcription-repair coupling factor (superfamily II helicase) [Nitrospirae bacterium]|nr:MAG: transcription-repair coupling factor (superfamily II helicase) [Nitrospirota bacterium]
MLKTWEFQLADHAGKLLAVLSESSAPALSGCTSAHLALLIAASGQPAIAVEETPERAQRLFADLRFFRSLMRHGQKETTDAVLLPPAGSPESIGRRAKIVRRIAEGEPLAIVASAEAHMVGFGSGQPQPLTLARGQSMERSSLAANLIRMGYRKVELVVEPGEYAERSWVVDIFPVTETDPVRIEFFGDTIELMRRFEVDTQRSISEIPEITLYPAAETETTLSILELAEAFGSYRFFVAASVDACPEHAPVICFTPLAVEDGSLSAGALPIHGLGILPEERKSTEDIAPALQSLQKRILAVLPSHGQADRLHDLLTQAGLIAPLLEIPQAAGYKGLACITTGELSGSLHLGDLMIVTGRELFGERPAYRALKRSKVSGLLLTIDDLQVGDLIVHKDHGIGRFAGMQHQKTEGIEEDFLVLEYAGGDRIYLPFSGVERIQKYRGGEEQHPPLDKLGGRRFASAKKRVKQSLQDLADKLLKLYAERKAARGFVFSPDEAMHREFDDFFPYEETEDQQKATEAIKKQMYSDAPMDILLCGDAGYGKTEVAIKAAFRAVFDGKQVAMLVPTTLLAEQHYRTIRQRFSGFPVRIDYLSRFRPKADVDRCLEGLRRGEIDIVIGTHMLLGKRMEFHDIGLLIIDEEHRFGVAQKERLKELKKSVDVLSITATPIPRTLHMALANVRELCTIQTPPEDRLAVRSIVTPWNDQTIQDAIRRELRRDGQVFFLHNRIHDMELIVEHLRKLVPEAHIGAAHGQMNERQLERIMLDFLDRTVNVLVCTAIIGSGIDIPSANTIIIDRADTFGLADLYQLRGRVGRSDQQAYAYFLIPGHDALHPDARRRLQAIQEMSYLGAGFRLAMRDLEIRGAGNLLGAEQSGHIARIGFDLYAELLERTVRELKGEAVADAAEPQIQLCVSAFVPDDYVADTLLRLSLYRRIAAAQTKDKIARLVDEVRDRFGPVPPELANLFAAARIKVLARSLRLSRIAAAGEWCRCLSAPAAESVQERGAFHELLLAQLLSLQKERSALRLRLEPQGFAFRLPAGTPARIETIEKVLASLAPDSSGTADR